MRRVRCLSRGTTTIVVAASTTLFQRMTVTCTPLGLIDVTPTTTPFTHVVGTTLCPQNIGTIRVTNLTAAAVSVTLTPSSPALTLDRTTASVPANGFVDVVVFFNCSVQTGFSATVSIVASNGTTTDTKTVRVDATINR